MGMEVIGDQRALFSVPTNLPSNKVSRKRFFFYSFNCPEQCLSFVHEKNEKNQILSPSLLLQILPKFHPPIMFNITEYGVYEVCYLIFSQIEILEQYRINLKQLEIIIKILSFQYRITRWLAGLYTSNCFVFFFSNSFTKFATISTFKIII